MAELDAELKVLLKHWEETITKVQKATKLPSLVYEETSRTVAMLRDLFNPSYENIYVNDETVFNEVKDYVALIAPERTGIVKRYTGQLLFSITSASPSKSNPLSENRFLQERSLPDYRTYGSTPCGGRKQRKPFQIN